MTDKTTVELAKDQHKRIRLLAVQRDTSVKTEIRNAVALYLEQASLAGTDTPAPQPVQA
jgi:hypothetical protein